MRISLPTAAAPLCDPSLCQSFPSERRCKDHVIAHGRRHRTSRDTDSLN